MKKFNWNKIWNPAGIDFAAMKTMNQEQLEAYVHDVNRGEWAKLWIRMTYTVNYLNMNGYWQYILALWLVRI